MTGIRLIYAIAAAVVVLAGLASRRYRPELPQFLGDYSGDTLWALMVFLLISVVLPGTPLKMRATTALCISFMVEISQIYQAPWIISIRQTTLGGLVLGHGFLWTDFACYTVGIVTGAASEMVLCILKRRYSKIPSEQP